ncbi:MAG: asparagine synthetase B, partial [Oligoflexales bacterium]|nr:asparagine synthetase B [Oligoflexales bacterium]
VVEFGAQISPFLKMNALNEKYILKLAMKDLIPLNIIERKKQPYRAPDSQSFIGKDRTAESDWVFELLSERKLRESSLFNTKAVGKLVEKAQKGAITSVKDNMAFVGILSTQLIHEQFINSNGRLKNND